MNSSCNYFEMVKNGLRNSEARGDLNFRWILKNLISKSLEEQLLNPAILIKI